MQKQVTYKDAGVNIDAGNSVVDSIKPITQKTARPGTSSILGGFGGIFDLSKLDYKDPLLISTTDGVGTKLKIAQQVNKHTTIGIDLVAMCVNDLVVHGAEPLFFLDYLSTSKLNVEQATNIIKGIAHGCKEAGCALSGGETAELPGVYQHDEYDLAGFSVGIVERTNMLPKKENIKAGDVVIGLPSSGLHSNGFSLVRLLIEEYGIDIFGVPPFESDHRYLYNELLEPTKIYIQSLLPLVKKNTIKALANITGGGLLENVPRILPQELGVELNSTHWEIQPIFKWIQKLGNIERQEMFRTFNMGIGMTILADKEHANTILESIKDARIIGNVMEIQPGNKQVVIK